MPIAWQNMPWQKIGTIAGACIGGLQRSARIYNNAPGKALKAQLQEAQRLLQESPHQDRYVRRVTQLKKKVKARRQKAFTWQDGHLKLIVRDSVIGGILGNLLGFGANKVLKRPFVEPVVIRPSHPPSHPPRPASVKKPTVPDVPRKSPFDPQDYQKADRQARVQWKALLKKATDDDLINPSAAFLAKVNLEMAPPEIISRYASQIENAYAAVIPYNGRQYLYISDMAKQDPDRLRYVMPHEIYHAVQKLGFYDGDLQNALKSNYLEGSDVFLRSRFGRPLANELPLNWTARDVDMQNLLRKQSAETLANLKRHFIDEIQAHRAGRRAAGSRMLPEYFSEDIRATAYYKRCVYMIGQAEQWKDLLARRNKFRMRVPDVGQRLTRNLYGY